MKITHDEDLEISAAKACAVPVAMPTKGTLIELKFSTIIVVFFIICF